MTNSN